MYNLRITEFPEKMSINGNDSMGKATSSRDGKSISLAAYWKIAHKDDSNPVTFYQILVNAL
jgi:hypothetical protein